MSDTRQPSERQRIGARLFELGLASYREGNWEQARASYTLAWALSTEYDLTDRIIDLRFFNSWHLMALALHKLERPLEAEAYLRRALEGYEPKRESSAPESLFAIASVYAMLGETDPMYAELRGLFAEYGYYIAKVWSDQEAFVAYRHDSAFQAFIAEAISLRKASCTSFSDEELPLMGCDNCRPHAKPTDHHDWTIECHVCGNSFAYSGCSCDACTGGPYARFGGGRTTYQV